MSTKELFVCVRITIEDEDPSLNTVDAERLRRAIQRGFPFAPCDAIEVAELDEVSLRRLLWDREHGEKDVFLLELAREEGRQEGYKQGVLSTAQTSYDRGFADGKTYR